MAAFVGHNDFDAETRGWRVRQMTLRLRLVVALVVLLTVGLTIFGVVVTSFYSRSLYQRLDDDLRGAAGPVLGPLRAQLGLSPTPFGGRVTTFEGPGGPRTLLAADLYAEIRDSDGNVLGSGQLSTSGSTPKLPSHLVAGDRDRYLT